MKNRREVLVVGERGGMGFGLRPSLMHVGTLIFLLTKLSFNWVSGPNIIKVETSSVIMHLVSFSKWLAIIWGRKCFSYLNTSASCFALGKEAFESLCSAHQDLPVCQELKCHHKTQWWGHAFLAVTSYWVLPTSINLIKPPMQHNSRIHTESHLYIVSP